LPNLCRRGQIADGTWVPEHLARPPYLPPFGNNKLCGPAAARYNASPAEGWDTYQWVPNDSVVPNDSSSSRSNSRSNISNNRTSGSPCHFPAWDRTLFCGLVRYATILIVGDSLSWENCASLLGLLGAPSSYGGYQLMSRLRNVNVGHAVCDGTARVVYRCDDDLSKVRDALFGGEGGAGGSSSNGSSSSSSNGSIPQVLVLNRGAHYKRDERYVRELRATLDVVEEWLGRCHQLKIKCHFFWRTTVPGHIHCHQFTEPVNDLAAMEAHVANLSLYDPTTLRYHWHDVRRQNQLAEAELARRKGRVPHRVLDGYRINLRRPDGHLDCLHSCYPGKMDVYAQLLLHYLRGDRTVADVDRLRSVYEEQGWDVNVTTVLVRGKGPT
jgi:hypothetical protein